MKSTQHKLLPFVLCCGSLLFSASIFAADATTTISTAPTGTATTTVPVAEVPTEPPRTPTKPTIPTEFTPTKTLKPSIFPTSVDSSQLNRGLTNPSTGSMNIVTQVSVPCNVTMQQVETWVTNTAHQCGVTNTDSLCYVQLKAAAGATTTQNILTCPSYYSPLFSYGSAIVDASSPLKKLVYTTDDSRQGVSYDEYLFYSRNSYTCDGMGSSINLGTVSEEGATSSTSHPARYPSSRYSVGQWTTINGDYVEVTDVRKGWEQCYTSGGAKSGMATCTDRVCFGAYCTGAYIVVDYTIYGQKIGCTRPAGFFPQIIGTPAYNLPAPSTTYSPTTLMCGKVLTRWKAVSPTGTVDPNACVPLPP